MGRGRFASPDALASQRASLRAAQAAQAKADIAAGSTATIVSGVSVFMKEAIEAAAVNVSSEVRRDVELFAESLRNNTRRNRDARVREIHQIAGLKAQVAMVAAFKRKHPRRGTSVSNSRLANGVMVGALSDPGFFTARHDGVAFGNRAFLDSRAKQWYRLSFGAGDAGGLTPKRDRHRIEFFGALAGRLSLRKFEPSPAFRMPPGIWIDKGSLQAADSGFEFEGEQVLGFGNPERKGGSDEFLAAGPNKARLDALREEKGQFILPQSSVFEYTKGIVGSNYLDSGVRVLAKSIGDGWTVLMREWFVEAENSGTGPVARRAAIDGISSSDIQAANARFAQRDKANKVIFAEFNSPLR